MNDSLSFGACAASMGWWRRFSAKRYLKTLLERAITHGR
jgi:hypothetical protein